MSSGYVIKFPRHLLPLNAEVLASDKSDHLNYPPRLPVPGQSLRLYCNQPHRRATHLAPPPVLPSPLPLPSNPRSVFFLPIIHRALAKVPHLPSSQRYPPWLNLPGGNSEGATPRIVCSCSDHPSSFHLSFGQAILASFSSHKSTRLSSSASFMPNRATQVWNDALALVLKYILLRSSPGPAEASSRRYISSRSL